MDKLDSLIKELQDLLSEEVPDKYSYTEAEFNKLINEEKYRAAYAELDSLRRKTDFHPSVKLLGAIERFQIVF